MTLTSSMFTSANGLAAHADAINVLSDNIANVNTVGYKEEVVRFSDVIANTPDMTATSGLNGQGSMLSGVEEQFTQGALLSTGNATDLALEGDGFFVLSGGFEGIHGQFFTRAGQFHLDSTGKLVNFNGLAVQGFPASTAGTITYALGDIKLQTSTLAPPVATTAASVVANLDSNSAAPAAFAVANASTTSNWSNNVVVYDSRGESHTMSIYYRNTGANDTWEWHAVANGAELTGTPSGPQDVANGTLVFNTSGQLTSVTTTANSIDFLNATQAQVITWNFGDPTGSGGTGEQGVTSYASNSNVAAVAQDGHPEGSLAGITIGADGTITGSYDNGLQETLGQVAIARFTCDEGLARVGGTLWVSTQDSGEAAIGTAGSSGRGSISAGSLEQSNVNLSQQLINLLAYQRGFEANTRTVQASDQMMRELVNLGR